MFACRLGMKFHNGQVAMFHDIKQLKFHDHDMFVQTYRSVNCNICVCVCVTVCVSVCLCFGGLDGLLSLVFFFAFSSTSTLFFPFISKSRTTQQQQMLRNSLKETKHQGAGL
jgi:hypothetical protein